MQKEFSQAVVAASPASVATNATQTLTFDAAGYDRAIVRVLVSDPGTNPNVFTTLKFLESDTSTAAASMTAITELVGGGTGGFVLPTAAECAGGGVAAEFQLDLKKRKRYIAVQATPAAALTLAMTAELMPEVSKDSAAGKGLTNYSNTNAKGCAKLVQV